MLQWPIDVLIKKTSATRTNKFDGSRTKNENKSHKELAKELLFKPTIKKIQKRKVHSSFADNIWGCWSCWYEINKQIFTKRNDVFLLNFSFCVLSIFLVNIHGLFLWKTKTTAITNAFQTILDECNCKNWQCKGRQRQQIL